METSAGVTAEQSTKPSDDEKHQHSGGDVSEAKVTSPKNIMFPSLSDEMLSQIVDVRCNGDASKQSRYCRTLFLFVARFTDCLVA